MSDLSKSQKEEIRKIIPYLKSSDKELNILGLTLLKKSSVYHKMKPRSLFFSYPLLYKHERVSNIIATANWNVKHNFKIHSGCITMLYILASKNCEKYFTRMFINTAEIL